jgi:hypothetical protein
MKRLFLLIFAILAFGAAIAFAVPLTPGSGPFPGPIRQTTTWHSTGGFQLSSTTITIGSSATWYPIHNATDNLWVQIDGNGFTVANDNITALHKGDFHGHLTIAVSGTSGDDIFVRAFNVTDNTATGNPIGVTVTGAANFQNISLPLYLNATAANKVFRFDIMNNTAGRNVTVRSAVFQVFYLHD